MKLIAVLLLSAPGCGLLDDERQPCPDVGPTAPIPAPTIEPPADPGDFGFTERYRKLSDGTVCVCGPYEIGCHDTPEGAEATMVCGYDAQGQPECEPYALPSPPTNAVPDAEELSDPVLKWSCPYKWRQRYSDSAWRSDRRIRQAQTYSKANWSHFAWCESKSDNSWEYKCSDCDTTPVP